jgi:YVTN family beta-propeller protein
MQFRDLGPLEVVIDGRVVDLGSGRQVALLGALLVRANEVVSVDRLVDDLWSGTPPPPTAAKIVRNYVSALRRVLGDRLVTRSPGYLLRVEPGERDSERLERAVASSDLDQLTDALALWRGAPLSQLAYEPFAEYEIARLEELHRTSIEARIDADLEHGRHASLVPELEALVREHPLRERLIGQLMLALYRSGRQADALEVYGQARRRLGSELGIEPGPALKELERKILNQDESLGGPRPAAEEKPVGRRRRGLPLVVAGAAVLLAAAALAAVLATRGSSGGLREVRPNHVGVIDPNTNRIVAEIPVGIDPGPLAAGRGIVWVGNGHDRNLTKIDARRRAVLDTFSLDNRTPTGLAADRGAVWIAHGARGLVSRLDARFGQITDTLHVTPPAYAAPTGAVAVGFGKVWAVFGNSTLVGIERFATPRVTGRTPTGSEPAAVVVGGGAVWVANSGDATVQLFDPVTFAEGPVGTCCTVGKRPVGIAYGAGAVWVADQGDDTVTRIDPATESTRTISVGADPVAIAFGEGAVWVANSGDGTISRIDPGENKVVRTIEVGNAPFGITIADGSVWVTSQTP